MPHMLGRRHRYIGVCQQRRCLVGIVILAAFVGCGYKPKLPPMAEVVGTVTLDGKPLTRGTIQFVPQGGTASEAPVAVGTIDEQGRYELMTQGVKGAMVGSHSVRVESRAVPRNETDTMPPSLIPLMYNNPAESPLTFEVKADQQPNTIDIPLFSRPQR